MKEIFRNNSQFILISLIWLIVGMFAGPTIYVLLPLMLLLMYSKGMHLEILLGFFYVLTLSDSRLYQLSFYSGVKNIYIVMLFLFSYKEFKYLETSITFYKNFIPFFLVALICVLFSPNISVSIQKMISYFLVLVSVPNYFLFVYKSYGTQLFRGLVFFVTSLLLLGLVIDIFNPSVTNLVGRYRGLFGNPNGLGLFSFLFIVVFVVINEYFEDLFSRNEKWLVYGLLFISLLRCGARTSLITTLFFLFFKKFYKISPWVGFLVFCITLLVYQLVSDNLVQIVSSLGLQEQLRVNTLENGSGRLVAWTFAWEHIQHNFFLGRGFNYTDYLFKQYYEYLSMLGHQGAAHNAYLTFWLDNGLIGLVLYLTALLLVFLKAAKTSTMAIPFLYSILISNNYESWLTASLNPFTIQVLFVLTIFFIKDNENKDVVLELDEKNLERTMA